jgi:outer membrane protein
VWSHAVTAFGVLAPAVLAVSLGTASPVVAQGAQKIAVIDVNRIMTDSQRGKSVLAGIEKMQSERSAQLKTLNDELTEMQKRFQEGRLSLAEDKLAELQGEIEEKDRAFKRAREDAERDIQKRRQDEIEKIENAVFPIINGLGKEGGYTMIFNKFQSGLVYADDSVDITAEVIKRLDAGAAPSTGQ